MYLTFVWATLDKNFKLPSVNFTVEIMCELKEENSSSQDDQPIQEGKWLEIVVQRHYAKAGVGRLK